MNKERLLSLKISTFIVITSCVFVICAGMLVNQNFKKAVIFWGDNVQITAYINRQVSDEAKKEILEKINAIKFVTSAQLVSREVALEDFTNQMASFAKEIMADKELLNYIPSSIVISISSNLEPQQQLDVMKSIQADVRQITGIDEVYFGADYIEKLSTITTSISGVLYVLTLILLSAGILVFSNSIRASIFHRQEEIKIYELVGATPWDIRKPFLLESALMGFFASLISVFGLYALFFIFSRKT